MTLDEFVATVNGWAAEHAALKARAENAERLVVEGEDRVTAAESAADAAMDAASEAEADARRAEAAEQAAQAEASRLYGVVSAMGIELDGRDTLITQLQKRIAELEAGNPNPDPEPEPEPEKPRGMLVGTSGGTTGTFNHAALVAAAGREMGVRRSYWSATQVGSMVSQSRADIAKGSLPWPTLRFPGGWAAVAAGTHDAWLRDVRDRLIALDAEVWVGFHHEPENDEGSTVAAHANWREAQRRAASIFAEKPSKVKFWLVTTGYAQDHPSNGTGWDTLYPTGAKIDGIAYDVYNWYGQAGKTTWSELPRQMDSLIALAKAKGAMWGIAETALTDEAFANTANDGAGWMTRAMDYAARNGAVAFAYFDYTNSGVTWPLIPGKKRDQFVAALKASPKPY